MPRKPAEAPVSVLYGDQHGLLSIKDMMNLHIGSFPILRESDPVAFIEPICDHAHGTRVRVQAINLSRQEGQWSEMIEEAISSIRYVDKMPLRGNINSVHGISEEQLATVVHFNVIQGVELSPEIIVQ